MSSFHDYQWASETLATARSKSKGKPVQSNTRLFERDEGSIAVKLHNTDVVTINADGTWTLASGGWNTVTTLDRIRGYSPARLFSERGEWFVSLEPDPNDPEPERYDRSVPKPFTASDPGPEPIKSDEGCVAGQLVNTEHVNEAIEVWRKDMQDGDEFVEVVSDGFQPGGDYDRVKVRRSWIDHIWFGEASAAYRDDGWREFAGLDSWGARDTHTINDGEAVTYVQCSHCKAFDSEHAIWRYGMEGERWGSRFDQQKGYATYREMMDRFGSQEAWQEAYIADFRARREYLKAAKEWDRRNRVPFYDGITVDSSGYAKRERKSGPSAAKLKRHEAKVAKLRKQIDKYASGYVAELRKGTLPMPSGGDCWYCALSTHDGVPMGDAMDTLHPDGSLTVEPSHGHLHDHLKERYYVPSLAVNALRERGYADTGVYIWLDMNPDAGTMGKPEGRYDGVKRDLVKYLRRRIIPPAPTK